MTSRVFYFSRGGNTKKVAHAIAKGAGAKAEAIEPFSRIEAVDVLFVGCAIYAGNIPSEMRNFLLSVQSGQVKKMVVFSTSMGARTPLPEIRALMASKHIPVAEREFHSKGSFLFFGRGRPNTADLLNAEEFAAAVMRATAKELNT